MLLDAGRLPRSYALGTLAIEESHKLPIVWKLMMQLVSGETPHWSSLANAKQPHAQADNGGRQHGGDPAGDSARRSRS